MKYNSIRDYYVTQQKIQVKTRVKMDIYCVLVF